MIKPLVSIIIPVFNAEKYLEETILSAINQTWANKEIIVINNGSTDNSLGIANKYLADGVKVFSQVNKGASSARNLGLTKAKGNYIQFLDADDLLSNNKITDQMNLLIGHPGYVAICATVHFFDDEPLAANPVKHDWYATGSNNPVDFLTKLYAGEDVLPGFGGMITIHSWLTPRTVIDKAGFWNERLSVDDDGEYFARVVLASNGVKYSHAGISYYRKYRHKQSLSAQKNRANFESIVLAADLKFQYLKEKTDNPLIGRIFAKHYWWTGVSAYPQFKDIAKKCINKAKQLGYQGHKYVGGPAGHLWAKIFGWKAVRLFSHYKNFKN
jgi:glycosyltransferase involved in cell wall biosynthesis